MSSFFKRLGIGSKDISSLSNGSSNKELESALTKEPVISMEDNQYKDRQLERFFGMDNLGNTCYCNSVLQSLYFCRPLRELMINIPSSSNDDSMYSVLRSLFLNITNQPKRTGIIPTESFVNKLREVNELFRSTTHQDAHEFLNFLLNRISEEMADKDNSQNSLIHSLFQGTLTNETRCMTCENITHRDESFLDLSINVEEDSTVTDCLQNFSVREMLGQKNKFFCDSCGGLQEAQKWMRIKKLPNIFALHLKRFKYQEEQSKYIKLSYRVAFPFQLEPTSLSSTCQGAENSDRMYSLFAVIIHIGNGPYHGHYVSIIKSYDRWVLFDDDKVSVVDDKELSKFFGNDPAGEGYVFFYETVDLDRSSIGLPEKPTPQAPFSQNNDSEEPMKGSYLKKKGSFSAPPSPNIGATIPSTRVNSNGKISQSTAANEPVDLKSASKRRGSVGSTKEKDVSPPPFGMGSDRVKTSSSRRPSSSGSLFRTFGSSSEKKDKVKRPSTSHGSPSHPSAAEKDKSWFGSRKQKSWKGESVGYPSTFDDQPQQPRVRSDSNPQKSSLDSETKRTRRRSYTYSSQGSVPMHSKTSGNGSSRSHISPTLPSTSQFATSLPAHDLRNAFTSKSPPPLLNPERPSRVRSPVSPPPPLISGKLSAAQVRKQSDYSSQPTSPPPPSPSLNASTPMTNNNQSNRTKSNIRPATSSGGRPTNDDTIGASPQVTENKKSNKKSNIFTRWIEGFKKLRDQRLH